MWQRYTTVTAGAQRDRPLDARDEVGLRANTATAD
jgi:hypothetical protein